LSAEVDLCAIVTRPARVDCTGDGQDEEGELVSFVDQPLTPQMRAALTKEQHTLRVGAACFPFLMAVLGLIYAVIARQTLGELLRFMLLMWCGGAVVTGTLWFFWERRYRAAMAADIYRHYSGQFTIRADYRRNRTIWRIIAADTTLTLNHRPREWDAAWFVTGEAIGTLLYAPEARHLFAAWDRGGRLIYRSNVYDLAADTVSHEPVAG
jgi:hypothetical protein